MDKRTYIALSIIFTGASVFLFNTFYKEAKNTAITKLNEEQTILARQAVRGIEDFFATWTRSLNSLSKMDAIIDDDAVGKRYLKLFYEANRQQIRSISRLDEKGVILYNFPSSSSVGADISDQKHVRELLRDHKPVISDVFRAVEGFDSVALHVPLFRGSVFKGSIGILINFQSLAKRYLDVIKIGETGYAWVVSRDGTQLYGPVPGGTGKSVFESIKDFPSLVVMVNDMLKGREGAATYTYDKTGDRDGGQNREYAIYMPVHLGNTFWSVAVASSEQDVLSGLISFRNRLALVIGALFICAMVFSTLGAKAWLIVNEEEKRKQAEKQLRDSEQRLSDITFSMADWVWEVDENGVYTYSSSKGLELFGHVVGKTPFDFMPPDEAKKAAAIFSGVAANKARIKDLENWNITKDGERICLLTNGVPVLDKEGNLKGYRGVDKDITGRKRAEEALRESEARYRGVVETQSEMICRFLPDTTLLFVNESYERYYGRSREDLIGSQFLSHVPAEQHEDIIRYFASFGPDRPVVTSEREAVLPDGERRWQRWTDHAFFNENGTLAGFQSVGRDITDRKKAEETLRKSEAALRHTQKDLQRLAGRLIFAQEEELRRLSRELHDDLTQRLAVLAIEAGKLELGLSKIPEPWRETLQTISGMKDQLIKVSEDVHNISRQIHPTILDDLGLVRAIESECAALMRREDIEIVFSKEDVPAAIDNNIALCLYRVLQESLKNVVTHSGAKSCRIFLKGTDDAICLTVTDDGAGFDPAEVRHKPGLGLSSMRERVHLVQGDFSIKSQTGKGTAINVRVPLAAGGA